GSSRVSPAKSRIAGFAIAGGVLGATLATLLTVVTSKQVGIVTGGMPVVSPWAFGIIVFELTMLGAILAALGRMVFESGLLIKTTSENYDDAVSEGKIVVEVRGSERESG